MQALSDRSCIDNDDALDKGCRSCGHHNSEHEDTFFKVIAEMLRSGVRVLL